MLTLGVTKIYKYIHGISRHLAPQKYLARTTPKKEVAYLSIERSPRDHMLMVRVTLSTKALKSHTTVPVNHLLAIVVTSDVGITIAPENTYYI